MSSCSEGCEERGERCKYMRDKGLEITSLSNNKEVDVRSRCGVRPCVLGLGRVCGEESVDKVVMSNVEKSLLRKKKKKESVLQSVEKGRL